MKKKLAIVGPYPPPIGGISVHIQRLEYFLKKANISYIIYNHYKFNKENVIGLNKNKCWYLKFLWNKQFSLIHFHQFVFFHFPYYYFFSILNPTKIIITIHNEKILSYPAWKKKMILWWLKKTKYHTLISVSKNLSNYLNQNKIKNIFLPAYVPAMKVKQKKINFPQNKIPFLFSVWKIDKNTSEDVYNIPLILSFLKKHKERFYMVMMIGSKEESDLNYLESLLQHYDLKNNENYRILFNLPLTEYFQNFRFLVRTNLMDGFGVSLQEAMDANIPSIASDVCLRPKGTVLFKNNDLNDLERKIFETIERKKPIYKESDRDEHLKLIEIYHNTL